MQCLIYLLDLLILPRCSSNDWLCNWQLSGFSYLSTSVPPTPCQDLWAKLADWLICVTWPKPPHCIALRVAVRFAALRLSIVTPLYCFRSKYQVTWLISTNQGFLHKFRGGGDTNPLIGRTRTCITAFNSYNCRTFLSTNTKIAKVPLH